jgi:dTDP-4-dehydrorhamnose reductase
MKTIAITGSRGLLGSTLLRVPIPGYESIALSADIREASAVLAEIQAAKPDWIIHTAAMTDVVACERDPEKARAVNIDGTKNVVEAARSVGANLIYISTVSVFSGHTGNYTEDAEPDPVNVYNTTKRAGELATLSYEKGIVLRLNLVGVHPDGSRGKNFMEWLVDSARADKDMTLFNDQFINPLSNWTVTTLIGTIIEKNRQEKILHISSRDTLSKAAIGKLVLARFPDYAGTITEKSIDSIADGVVRPKQMWLNCDKSKKILGIELPSIASEIEIMFSSAPLSVVD